MRPCRNLRPYGVQRVGHPFSRWLAVFAVAAEGVAPSAARSALGVMTHAPEVYGHALRGAAQGARRAAREGRHEQARVWATLHAILTTLGPWPTGDFFSPGLIFWLTDSP